MDIRIRSLPKPQRGHYPKLQGGFILPLNVRKAEIVCEDAGTHATTSTFPSKRRSQVREPAANISGRSLSPDC